MRPWQLIAVLISLSLAGCVSKSPKQAKPTVPRSPGHKLTVVYEAGRHGMLEPCGCKLQPWGGLDRESNALKQIRKEDRDVLYVDAGNMFAPQVMKKDVSHFREKASHIVGMMNKMGLEAFAPGPSDFALGLSTLRKLERQAKFPFISTNIVSPTTRKPIFEPFTLIDKGKLRIGVLSLSPPIKDKKIRVLSTEETLKKWLPHVAPKSDLVIVFSQLDTKALEDVSSRYKDVHLVIGSKLGFETDEPFWFAGHTLMVDPVEYGHKLSRLDLDVQLPFKGFYSPKVVYKNQRALAALEADANAGKNKEWKLNEIKFMKENESLEAIEGGTIYNYELITLDKERFGSPNEVTAMIKKHKEEVRRRAMAE